MGDTETTPSTFWCNLIERFIKSGEQLKEVTEKNNIELIKSINSLKDSLENLILTLKQKPCLLDDVEKIYKECKDCIVQRYTKSYDLLLWVVVTLACGFVGYEIFTKVFLK